MENFDGGQIKKHKVVEPAEMKAKSQLLAGVLPRDNDNLSRLCNKDLRAQSIK